MRTKWLARRVFQTAGQSQSTCPLAWTMMPNFALPLAIRRDPSAGLTVIVMARRDDCFGVFTPYGEEKHYSNYLSFFGHDIEAGESAGARSRLVVLPDPTEAEILAIADVFRNSSRQGEEA